ncbi:MAG: hypothetical protein ACFFD2_30705 [Promethearchaeota archaeon]
MTLEVTLIDEYDFVNVYLNNQGWKMNVKDSVYYYWIPEILNLFGIRKINNFLFNLIEKKVRRI